MSNKGFHTSHLLPTQSSLKTNFITAIVGFAGGKRGGAVFTYINKLKSEIFNDKKSSSVTNKNLIWKMWEAWLKRGGGVFEGG